MNDTNLDETALAAIRQRAEAATPGPWRRSATTPWGSEVIFNESGEFYLGVSAKTAMPNDGWTESARERARELGKAKCADAAFIAGMDPQTTLALLDALADARRTVERLTTVNGVLRSQRDGMDSLAHGLRAERDAVVAAVAALADEADKVPSGLIHADTLRAVLSAPAAAETCPTPGCDGDVRYAAPGRGHIEGCHHPLSDPAAASAAHDADTAATALEEAADAWHPHRADANLKGTGAVTDTPTTVDTFYQGAVWAEKFLRARAAALRDGRSGS